MCSTPAHPPMLCWPAASTPRTKYSSPSTTPTTRASPKLPPCTWAIASTIWTRSSSTMKTIMESMMQTVVIRLSTTTKARKLDVIASRWRTSLGGVASMRHTLTMGTRLKTQKTQRLLKKRTKCHSLNSLNGLKRDRIYKLWLRSLKRKWRY